MAKTTSESKKKTVSKKTAVSKTPVARKSKPAAKKQVTKKAVPAKKTATAGKKATVRKTGGEKTPAKKNLSSKKSTTVKRVVKSLTPKAKSPLLVKKPSIKPTAIPTVVKIICQALADKKAENVKILNVSAFSSVTDFVVIATGTSEPHLRALRVELERELAKNDAGVIGSSMDTASGWLVVDAFDVMVHLFTEQMREHYRIESLWREAVPVKVEVK